MARAGLSGSEPGADLSAWLAKIMAQLSGSTAPSRAVYITKHKAKKHEIQVDLPSQQLNHFVNGFVERLHGA